MPVLNFSKSPIQTIYSTKSTSQFRRHKKDEKENKLSLQFGRIC